MPPGVPAPGALAVTLAVKVTVWPKTDGFCEEVSVVAVLSWLTTWLTVFEVLPASLVSPLYTAVIECDPTDSAAVLILALPPLSVTGPPKLEPSIWNCTVPPGVPAPGALAVTLAVKVTVWPKTDGFCEEVSVVAVLSWLTTWLTVFEVLPASLVSPLYTAVIECDPTDSAAVLMLALPPLSVTGPPKLEPSIWNCTVPPGVPAPGRWPSRSP